MTVFRSKFARHALVYTLANFSVAGIPFLLLPLLTRTLSPEAYGIVAMFSVAVPFFTILVGSNMHGAIMVRYFDPNCTDVPTYVTSCFAVMLVMLALLILGVFIFSEQLYRVTALSEAWLLTAVFTAAGLFPIQVLLVLWQSSKQPIKYAGLRLSQATLDGLLSIVLVVLIPLSWQGRIGGIALAAFFLSVVAIYLLIRNGWLVKSVSSAHVNDALRFGIPLLPHAIGGLLINMLDRFMVTNYLDVASTGIYFVGVQVGLILGIAADAFNRAFAPWLMESLRDVDKARDRRIVIFTYLYFAAILICAILGGLVVPKLLAILVGEKFQEAADVARYSLIGNAFGGMYLMVINYIFFSRRTELLSALTIFCGSATLGLSWYLIHLNGLIGAAQAYMLGQAMMFFGTWMLAQRCHKMPWFSIKFYT